MKNGILICGYNGCGKTTLGKELAKTLGYKFMDIEDYYFPINDGSYKYGNPRTRNEVIELLWKDINKNTNFIIASVKGDYGNKIVSRYSCVIMIDVPLDIRLKRVKNRSLMEFGDRMLPGGDLYEKESNFFNMVESRSKNDIEKWINTLKCPIIRIDGTKDVSYNVECIKQKLSNI